MAIALDPAASEFYEEESGLYNLRKEGRKLNGEEMVAFWKSWIDQYPIVSLEDGLAQDDWKSWQLLVSELGDRLQIVGDDLLVTNGQLDKNINFLAKPYTVATLLKKIRQILDSKPK